MFEAHARELRGEAEVANPEKRAELWARLTQLAPLYLGNEKRTTRTIQMVIIHPAGAA